MSHTKTHCSAEPKRASIGTFLAAASLLALVQFASLPPAPRVLGVINNFAHGPVFGALALVLLAWLRRRFGSRVWLAYASALLISAAAGLMLEILQIFSDRDASLADAVTNAVGAGCSLCFAAYFDRSIWHAEPRSGPRRVALVAGALLLFILLLPVGHALLAYAARANRFPTIMQFTSTLDMYFVELRDCEATFFSRATNGTTGQQDRALHIRFHGNDWPGISNFEPSPDWRQFSRLRIDVANPGASVLILGLRINDMGHGQKYEDRFNRQFTIGAGTRQVLDVALAEIAAAPVGRRLDLSRVGQLVLFRLSPETAQASEIHLTRVWLE